MADKTTKEVEVKISTPGAAQAQGQLTGLGRVLKDLNQAGAGAGISGQSGLVKLLKGGGLAVGLHFLAESAKEAAQAYNDSAQAGARSMEGFIGSALRAIPVVGSLTDAIEEIAEAWRIARLSEEEYAAEIKRGAELRATAANKTAAVGTYRSSVVPQDFSPERAEFRKTGEEIKKIQGILQYGAANPGALFEEDEQLYLEAAKNFEKRRYEAEEKIRKQENAFVGKVRERIGDFVDNFWLGLGKAFEALNRQGIDDEVTKEERLAQYRIAGEQAQAERDAIMKGESDIFGYSPAPALQGTEVRFTPGYGAGDRANSPEAQTAKNTAETNKKLDANTEAIRDLARTLQQDPSQIIYLR